MDRINGLLRWIGTLLHGKRFARDIEEEFRLHIELETEENIRRGMDPAEAKRVAGRDFGGTDRTYEQVREVGTVTWPGIFLRDIRYAVRTMAGNPLFTMGVVLVLGVGIGCNVAMYSLVHTTLVRPLPFSEPHKLVIGQATFNGHVNPWASAPDFLDYRSRCVGFSSLAAILPFPMTYPVTGGQEPERIHGTPVSFDLFTTLGVGPELGRLFLPADGTEGAPEVVIISHAYWQRRFGCRESAIGASLTVDGVSRTVVGVMPEGFNFMAVTDFWRPMRPDRDAASMRDRHNWLLIGRLKEGFSRDQVQVQADIISSMLQVEYPGTNEGKSLLLADLHEFFASDYRTGLLIMMAATGLLFLIACANVTGLFFARGLSRRNELAVRKALGASRGRLLHQLFIESILAALAAGVLGAVFALFTQPLILRFYPVEIPGVAAAGISLPVVIFTVILAVVTACLCGLVPALRSTGGEIGGYLTSSGRVILTGRSGFKRGLIFVQIVLTVVLLIGSGLLIRSLVRLVKVEPGFNEENLLTAELELPAAVYPEREQRIRFFTDVLERVCTSPGVESAALVNCLPVRDPFNVFRGYPGGRPNEEQSIFLRSVTADYFNTMQIPILEGRPARADDTYDSPRVCVVNLSLAEFFFPETNPVGRTMIMDFFGQPRDMEIVGIAGDVHSAGLDTEPRPLLYAPYPQLAYSWMQLVVRTEGDPSNAVLALRNAVRSLDRDIPVTRIAPMDELITQSVSSRRTMTVALTLYAVIPLFLAAVGLYGLIAYIVRQRFREIGVRVALGAQPGMIVALILRQGLGLVAIGIVAGFIGAVGVVRLIRHLLFRVEPTDPVTFLAVGVAVAVVALAACLVPTWQAVRINPVEALRIE